MSPLLIIVAGLLLQIAPTSRPAAIEGIVVKADTGQPAPKTVVQLEEAVDVNLPPGVSVSSSSLILGGANRSVVRVTTGIDGKFSFGDIQPGTYRVTARLAGYAFSEYGQRSPNGRGTPITLGAGQALKDIRLALIPQGAITGRVTGENGEPVSRAQVQALRYTYQEGGRRTLSPVQAVLTNDLGEYRLFWLPAGQYIVSAMPTDPRLESIPVLVLPPGGLDEASSVIVDAIGVHGTCRRAPSSFRADK